MPRSTSQQTPTMPPPAAHLRRSRPTYSAAQRVEALRRVRGGGELVSVVAESLGMSQTTVRSWLVTARAETQQQSHGKHLSQTERAELHHLRRRVFVLEKIEEIRDKVRVWRTRGGRSSFVFVDLHRGEWPVTWMCRALGVTKSGYYAWLRRPESRHAQEDRRLSALIRVAFARGRGVYGSPRVRAALRDQGEKVGRRRVARLMRAEGLVVRKIQARVVTTQPDGGPFAANLLARDFVCDAADRCWVGDVTYLRVASRFAYLAVLMDLYSRRVVGWSLSARNDRHLVLAALNMAARRRTPPRGLVHHSDRGGPYGSGDYRRRLSQLGAAQSMSRSGHCHDNAACESFFASLKRELGARFLSLADARSALCRYLGRFYNGERRHSGLGQRCPHNLA